MKVFLFKNISNKIGSDGFPDIMYAFLLFSAGSSKLYHQASTGYVSGVFYGSAERDMVGHELKEQRKRRRGLRRYVVRFERIIGLIPIILSIFQ